MRRVSSWGTRAEELDTKSCNLIWHEIVYTEFFLKSEGRRISSRCAKSINRRVVHGNELCQTEKYLHKQIIKHAELVPQHPEVSVWYVNKHSRFKGPTIITELRSEPRMRSTVVGCSDRKVHGSLSLVAFSLMTLMKTLFRLKIESDEIERRLKQVSFYSCEVQFHTLNSSEHWLFSTIALVMKSKTDWFKWQRWKCSISVTLASKLPKNQLSHVQSEKQ